MAHFAATRYRLPMATFVKMLSGDGLQNELSVNLERVAFVTFEGVGVRLHFSADPADFIDVIDYGRHVAGAMPDA